MIDRNAAEKDVLKYWNENNVEYNSNTCQPYGNYTLLYGPPFINSSNLHLGHILAGTIKDVFSRYHAALGQIVSRKFGQDTHGYPIESVAIQLEQCLIRDTKDSIYIKHFNDLCRSLVNNSTAAWDDSLSRVGHWFDYKHKYSTMDVNYCESVWWVFSQCYKQNRIYQAPRVMLYNPVLGTPVSNFESNSYKELIDPGLIVEFSCGDMNLLVYTTTPWTLPANVALCVNPDFDYSLVKCGEKKYVAAKSCIKKLFADKKYEVVCEFKGWTLLNRNYAQLLSHFPAAQNSLKVVCDSFVSEDGTGIVHLAPCYGAEDYNVCKKYNIGLLEILDDNCKSLKTGNFCKDDNKAIIDELKDRVFSCKDVVHSCAFDERTNSPLIYRAVSSWFLKIEDLKDRMLELNSKVNWVPDAVGENRFANWLEEARDWNISRNRIWGCTIPLWISADGEQICVESIEELEKLSGVKVNDLHKDSVDGIVIYKDGKEFKRTPEVLDCWFESGCMPYAQHHYPFENRSMVEKSIPADVVCEGLDQTRGWFYTLLVLSTILFDKAPYKNVVVNGLILGSDGSKMSKSKGNYADPMELVEKYGADAVRGYLIASGATHAEPLAFKEEDVEKINKDLVIPLLNACNFLTTYMPLNKKWIPKIQSSTKHFHSKNIMDRWIVAKTGRTLTQIKYSYDRYNLSKTVPYVVDLVDDLNNWYIRLNRKRFWKNDNDAFDTLYVVLEVIVGMLSPIMPFLTEEIDRKLNEFNATLNNSIHLKEFPYITENYIDRNLLDRMQKVRNVVAAGHALRKSKNLKVKQPLNLLYCVEDFTIDEKELIKNELNVKSVWKRISVEFLCDIEYSVNMKTLAPKAKGLTKEIVEWVGKTKHYEELEFPFKYKEVLIEQGDLNKKLVSKNKWAVDIENKVAVNTELTDELLNEGAARELISAVQDIRKTMKLGLLDKIELRVSPKLADICVEHFDMISETLLCSFMLNSFKDANDVIVFTFDKDPNIQFNVIKKAT